MDRERLEIALIAWMNDNHHSRCLGFLFRRGAWSRLATWLLIAVILGGLCPQRGAVSAEGVPPDVRFGAIEAFRDPVAASEAGVGWDRILFYWSELQPTGPDDWNGYHVPDDWLQRSIQDGREVVGLLKHTPAWATDGMPGCGEPRGLDLPVDDPGNLWATFVRRVVSIYGDRVHRWVIWNEPDIKPETYGNEWCGSMESYYRLLKVAYLAAREIDPTAQIHLAGLTFWHDRDYLGRFLEYAMQDPTAAEHGYYFEVVTLHIYFQTETVPYIINETRATLNSYGLQKPVWVNETNASPDSDPDWPLVRPRWRVNLDEQAGFLLQSYALALSAGAERVGVYKLKDVGLASGGEPFGLIRPDGSRRPAFDAYKLITSHYAGTQAAREDRYSLYDVVTLERDAATTRVIWARTGADASVSLPALASAARLIDQSGNEQSIAAEGGSYNLTLPGARCADEYLGCIIGGPTYLLVEDTGSAEGGIGADTQVVTATEPFTPTVTISASAPVTPAVEGETAVQATATWPPSSLPSPTPVPTETPTPMPTATQTMTPTPTPTSTPTATPTASPTPSPSSTPSPTSTPVPPTPTATATPRATWPVGLFGPSATLLLASLVLSTVVIIVWRGRSRRR